MVLDGMGGDRLGIRRFRLGGVVKFQRPRVWRCKDGCTRRKGWAGDDTNKEDEQRAKQRSRGVYSKILVLERLLVHNFPLGSPTLSSAYDLLYSLNIPQHGMISSSLNNWGSSDCIPIFLPSLTHLPGCLGTRSQRVVSTRSQEKRVLLYTTHNLLVARTSQCQCNRAVLIACVDLWTRGLGLGIEMT